VTGSDLRPHVVRGLLRSAGVGVDLEAVASEALRG
jgi:hypothetical protein